MPTARRRRAPAHRRRLHRPDSHGIACLLRRHRVKSGDFLEADRQTGVESPDSRQLPSANQGVRQRRDVIAIAFAAAHGNGPQEIAVHVVRHIEIRERS